MTVAIALREWIGHRKLPEYIQAIFASRSRYLQNLLAFSVYLALDLRKTTAAVS
jgi:hypothetical protein